MNTNQTGLWRRLISPSGRRAAVRRWTRRRTRKRRGIQEEAREEGKEVGEKIQWTGDRCYFLIFLSFAVFPPHLSLFFVVLVAF